MNKTSSKIAALAALIITAAFALSMLLSIASAGFIVTTTKVVEGEMSYNASFSPNGSSESYDEVMAKHNKIFAQASWQVRLASGNMDKAESAVIVISLLSTLALSVTGAKICFILVKKDKAAALKAAKAAKAAKAERIKRNAEYSAFLDSFQP